MRKVLLASFALVLSVGANAQQKVVFNRTNTEAPVDRTAENSTQTNPQPAARTSSTQAIWSEDFANGIPASWTNEPAVTGKPTSIWEYRGPNSTPNNNTGSRGAFAGTQGPVQSATRANGFVIFDSDFLDNGGSSSGIGTGGTAPTPHAGRLITPNINLANYPFVRVSFTSFARRFAARFSLCVSRDGGTTWPDTLAIHSGLAVNAASTNNGVINQDIQAGSATTKIQFLFDGRTAFTGANGLGYYFWQIDDISISARPSNDLILRTAQVIQGPLDTVVAGNIFIPVAPKNQFRPTTWVSTILNSGSNLQPNTKVNVNVTKMGTSVYTNTSTPTALAAPASVTPVSSDIYMQNNPYSPAVTALDTGVYKYTYTVSSDSTDATPADNTVTQSYVVNDTMMSSIYFPPYNYLITKSATFATNGGGSFTNAADGCIGCAMISLAQAARIKSISVRLASGTRPGGDIVVHVRDTAGIFTIDTAGNIPALSNASSFPAIVSSDTYTLTIADSVARVVNVPIPDATLTGTNQFNLKNLSANKGYWICAEMFSNGGANRIGILDDQTYTQPSLSSIIFLPADGTNRAARWFSNFNSLGLAAAFGSTITGVNTVSNNIRSVYPNPTQDQLNVSFVLENSANVDFIIRDITGREVSRNSEGRLAAGMNLIQLNTASLKDGIYILEMLNGSVRSVERFVVKH